jgi:dolichol kinase
VSAVSDFPGLSMFAWLILAWGIALIVIAFRKGGRKRRAGSTTHRMAGVLNGAVFCFVAAILFWRNSKVLVDAFVGAAIVAGLLSWYLGRRSR